MAITALITALITGLLVAGCSSTSGFARASDDPDQAAAAQPLGGDESSRSSSGDDSTSQQDSSERGEARPRTPLVLPSTAPGTDEAMEALFSDLSTHVSAVGAPVPWPDLRNADPRAAYRSAAAFQRWISEKDPNPILVEGYTAPNSPERQFDLELFGEQQRAGVLWSASEPPYEMNILDLVDPLDSGVPPWILDQVPAGSVAIIYLDSWGRTELLDQQTGRVTDTINGWTDAGPWAAIMAPTNVGWQVWYDELTDPPLLLPPTDDPDPSLAPSEPSVRT